MRGSRKLKIWLLLFLVLFTVILEKGIRERSRASVLKENICEQTKFRQQYLSPELYREIREREAGDFGEILTATMLCGNFYPERVSSDSRVYRKYKKEEFLALRECYRAVWEDPECFPVAGEGIFYEDTFGAPRGEYGERIHEGTDLFGKVKEPGYYPVLSMTDGTVEKTGWLPLGGYRIGIRAPHGAYFYYAHLSEYERDFKEGEKIKAGDILGYMGNTGYGEEGTRGMFPVHLHLGIYLKTPRNPELSVNPYRVLKAAEKNMRKYTY